MPYLEACNFSKKGEFIIGEYPTKVFWRNNDFVCEGGVFDGGVHKQCQ